MGLKFTPPKDDTFYKYASYGNGQMKVHRSIGAAKQSLSNRCAPWGWGSDKVWREGFILESVGGEWFVLHHVPEGTKRLDAPWYRDVWTHKRHSWWTKLYQEPSNPEDYFYAREAYSMSKEEYAEWRIQVELERRGIVSGEGTGQ